MKKRLTFTSDFNQLLFIPFDLENLSNCCWKTCLNFPLFSLYKLILQWFYSHHSGKDCQQPPSQQGFKGDYSP